MVFIGCLLDWITRIRRRAIVWIAWATVVAASFARVVYIFGIHVCPRFHKNCWISVSYTNGFGSYCWFLKISWLSKPRYRFIAAQTAALLETPASQWTTSRSTFDFQASTNRMTCSACSSENVLSPTTSSSKNRYRTATTLLWSVLTSLGLWPLALLILMMMELWVCSFLQYSTAS